MTPDPTGSRFHGLWLLALPLVLARAADPVPEAKDVRPGWIALVTVLLLCAASLFLWFSMRKQLRRIQVPRDGVDGPDSPDDTDGTDGPHGTDHERPGSTREPSGPQDA